MTRAQFTLRVVWMKQLLAVVGGQTVQSFQSQHKHLELYPLVYRQQMQVTQNEGDMIVFTLSGNDAGSSVLDSL